MIEGGQVFHSVWHSAGCRVPVPTCSCWLHFRQFATPFQQLWQYPILYTASRFSTLHSLYLSCYLLSVLAIHPLLFFLVLKSTSRFSCAAHSTLMIRHFAQICIERLQKFSKISSPVPMQCSQNPLQFFPKNHFPILFSTRSHTSYVKSSSSLCKTNSPKLPPKL